MFQTQMRKTQTNMLLTEPARLWLLSTRYHREGKRRKARLIKAYLFLFFRAALPPEAVLAGLPSLGHFAMNIVVHPNVSLGRDVRLWHCVTLSVSDSPGTKSRLTIGDRVEIGTGAVIIAPLRSSMSICNDVRIGANSVVTRSITQPGTYAGAPAVRVIPREKVE
ncbi:serine acetyltransferase [Rhizobium sp. SORGH_AS 787]|nr:serine acetyltransferase [Rhizobium sp. SORGH_AS_0787]